MERAWDNQYGLLVLAKIVQVFRLALGAYNNRYAVPRLKAGMASVQERRRLRVAGVELGSWCHRRNHRRCS
jgi:hypothetical protein